MRNFFLFIFFFFDSLKRMNFSPWYDFAMKGYLFVYGNTYNYPIFLTASGNAKVITYKQLLIDLVYINLPDLEHGEDYYFRDEWLNLEQVQ